MSRCWRLWRFASYGCTPFSYSLRFPFAVLIVAITKGFCSHNFVTEGTSSLFIILCFIWGSIDAGLSSSSGGNSSCIIVYGTISSIVSIVSVCRASWWFVGWVSLRSTTFICLTLVYNKLQCFCSMDKYGMSTDYVETLDILSYAWKRDGKAYKTSIKKCVAVSIMVSNIKHR